MKRILSVLFFSFVFLGLAHAGEIGYFNKTWDEIKAKAKAEHKYILCDCYTDWCGWCKVMDKETMPDPAVVSFMNDKFVCAKIEMEHGEGMKLAMKYHVTGFPTFMFFTPRWRIRIPVCGLPEVERVFAEVNNALNKSKQFSAPGFSPSSTSISPNFISSLMPKVASRKNFLTPPK